MGLRPLVPPQDKDNVHGSPDPRGKALCQPHEAESSAASAFLALLFGSVFSEYIRWGSAQLLGMEALFPRK